MIESLKISVIIPVYNVEKYLNQCVDSVLSQTYRNLEVILVDDGSPDCSPEICDVYHEKDSRVHVIHKQNGGAADARNVGIQHATGEYILFLDGDDYWGDSGAVSRLVLRIEKTNADLLNFSYIKFWEDTGKSIPYFLNIAEMPVDYATRFEQIQYLTKSHLYIASPCNKLVRRNLLTDAMLFEGGVFAEDIEWSARLLTTAQIIDFVPENFYYYRQRTTSISHSISLRICEDIKNHIIRCVQIADRSDSVTKQALYGFTAYQLGTYVKNQALAEQLPKKYNQELQQYQWLFRYHGNNRKLTVLYFLNRFLPLQTMCRLFRFIYHHHRN